VPSQVPYERSSVVKKKRRAVADPVCQPSSVTVWYGPRIHLAASFADVVLASIVLRPSTDSATAILRFVRLVSRIENSRPSSASM
jgi:hypothetical protein